MKKNTIAIQWITVACVLALTAAGAAAGAVNNRLYAELLQKYVHDGVVDYRGLKGEEEKLDRYLKVLEDVDTGGLSRPEQFAFYINAYNAWTLKLILTGYPGVKSIKDLGSLFKSPWKKKLCRLDGRVMTLDDIEHGILRPKFADPRVHFAIVCASKSCPPLISVPYCGSTLDQQLDDAARAFINDPGSNHFKDGTLYLSKLFKWFAGDFNNDPAGFVERYAGGGLKTGLQQAQKSLKIEYLNYNWNLNGK